MIYDFSLNKLSGKYYGGSEKKVGVIFNNTNYMLKFRKNTPFGKRNNIISEYIGSHIFQLLGINCQETYLGKYKGEDVVACKDFITDGYFFVPFNDVGESTIEEDKEKYQYSYEDIIKLLNSNKKLTNVEETTTSFFSIYIVDALIGNFDRHGSNWGFLKKDNKYSLAPVFDNGSCLFPNLTDDDIINKIINDKEEINKRVYSFPTSQIKLNNKKSSYYEVISSLKYDEINSSLEQIVPKVDINKINHLIDDIDIISYIQKDFYKLMIQERYDKILLNSYNKLIKEKRK